MRLNPDQVGIGLWIMAGLSALAWGGRPERWVGAMLLANLAAVVFQPHLSPGNAIHWWTMLLDVLVLGGMVAVQLRHDRAWLLTAIGFQSVSILAHVPRIMDPGIRRWAYVATTTYAGYAVILALMTGTILSALRRRDRPYER